MYWGPLGSRVLQSDICRGELNRVMQLTKVRQSPIAMFRNPKAMLSVAAFDCPAKATEGRPALQSHFSGACVPYAVQNGTTLVIAAWHHVEERCAELQCVAVTSPVFMKLSLTRSIFVKSCCDKVHENRQKV